MEGGASIAIEKLRGILRGYGSLVVAFSGGVDSAVVLALAREELGDRVIGAIGNSAAYPARELADARELGVRLNVPIRVVETGEQRDPRYLANTADRCFYCRSDLFDRLARLAAEEGFAHVADGVHQDDLADHAGGMKAARRYGVRSPLLEAGLGKASVRAVARRMNLPVWDKPALACLASRLPSGTPITPALLRRVAEAEESLRVLGFTDFRVRHHGDLARIELRAADMPKALECSEIIVGALAQVGYRHVTLDLKPRRDLQLGVIYAVPGPPPGAI
ncbi:MAG TPA: ATP-dependent sacrificial sulfur transferase LarE [Tepidisphaeraceae bacterium]|nr:ATP-dependent sacrificial sulfur transferase LarE [Tepidisphaeraceae bacterium]